MTKNICLVSKKLDAYFLTALLLEVIILLMLVQIMTIMIMNEKVTSFTKYDDQSINLFIQTFNVLCIFK
jgi:hypothetical protein